MGNGITGKRGLSGDKWLTAAKGLITAPVFPGDEAKTREAYWLNVVLVNDIWLLLAIIIGGIIAHAPPMVIWVCAGAILIIPLLHHELHKGQIMMASFGLILALALVITVGLYHLGTVSHTGITAFVILVVTTGLVSDRRLVNFTVILTITLVSFLFVASHLRILPAASGSDLFEWVVIVTFILYAGVFTTRIQINVNDAIKRAHREIDERARAEQSALRAGNFLQGVINALEDPVIVKDANGHWLVLNDAACDMLGHSREALLGKGDSDFFTPEQANIYAEQDHTVLETGATIVFEENVLIHWEPHTLSTKKSRYIDPPTGDQFICATIRDLTLHKRMEEAMQQSRDDLERQVAERTAELRATYESLRESEERYALAAQGANDGLWDIDLTERRSFFSPRWNAMLGYESEDAVHRVKDWMNLIHPEDRDPMLARWRAHMAGVSPHYEIELRARHRDGQYRWFLVRGLVVRDRNGKPHRIAGSMSDITERKRIEARLLHEALHDTLTGLPNRALLLDRLEQAVRRQKRYPERRFALLFIDLDRFKDVNDSLSHSIGDQLLVAVAQRVKPLLRESDTLARLGGDEFVVLLAEVSGEEAARGTVEADEASNAATRSATADVATRPIAAANSSALAAATVVAERILAQISQPYELNGLQVTTSGSIGIVLGSSYEQAEQVLRDADIAMYRAKALGRARYQVFDVTMHDAIVSRIRMEGELRQALEQGEFEVFYQPILRLSDQTVLGFETLARWRHPRRGLLLPGEFIPLAEESLLVIPLDRWVMNQACRQASQWATHFGRPVRLSINLSSKQFSQPDLIEQIQRTLAETGFPAEELSLEITESTIMENTEAAAQTLRQLQALGAHVGIDDFGTGFSSLTYLLKLPVNILKIDRSFIREMGTDPRKTEVVRAMIDLAHNIGLEVVAEGIETPDQLAQLREMHCDYAQGFLFSPPVEAEKSESFLRG